MHADSFPAEPPGKPKNTGVGSLSLLQGIFLTQESNWGLLHCRWILYRLSHQGRPRIREWVACPFSRDLPDPGIELGSPALQVDSLPAEPQGKPLGGRKPTFVKEVFAASAFKSTRGFASRSPWPSVLIGPDPLPAPLCRLCLPSQACPPGLSAPPWGTLHPWPGTDWAALILPRGS